MQAVLSLAGTVVLIVTLLLLRREVKLQQDDLVRQSQVWHFEIYQRIDNRLADLVWRQSEDHRLSTVYEPLTAAERERLDREQASAERWGAWAALTPDEKVCYRFIRVFLETIEQMWEVRSQGWMSDDMWAKWQGWIEVWVATRYFPYVFEDQRPRLLPRFVAVLDEAVRAAGERT